MLFLLPEHIRGTLHVFLTQSSSSGYKYDGYNFPIGTFISQVMYIQIAVF